MLTYSTLGNEGNLGNNLFQIHSVLGLGKKFGNEVAFPANWRYGWGCFENIPPLYDTLPENFFIKIKEKHFHYDIEQWEGAAFDADIEGWLQSEKYFDEVLRFKQSFINKVSAKYPTTRPTIGISVRRGDYVDNPNYHLPPISFYLGALLQLDYKNSDILVFSDDIAYCRIHFNLPNVRFVSEPPLEQLALMSTIDTLIIANSTFSWWGAYLGKEKKVIRPKKHFKGKLLRNSDPKDFWPESWEVFDGKIDLKDVTFTIPLSADSQDRRENLELTIKHLRDNFDTNIIVMENQTSEYSNVDAGYIYSNYPTFHRTAMLNRMAKLAKTPIVVNWDADVFAPPIQIIQAVDLIREGTDIVYPYDGRFARVPRTHYPFSDVGVLKERFKGMNKYSYGGAVVANRKSYLKMGGENENFISYGPEDVERYRRFDKLGAKIKRVGGILYHLDHEIKTDSSISNPHFEANCQEFEKICYMTKRELKSYINSWHNNC